MPLFVFVIVKCFYYILAMEIYQLRHLAAFSECGNLSRAAKKVFTSQPALSRSMKNLEEEIGVPLFSRTKNSISLNEFGELAAEKARVVLTAHDDMIFSIREADRRKKSFSYGSIAPAPIWELTPILSQLFMGRSVNTDLKESEEELLQGLDEGAYNLIITLRPIDNLDEDGKDIYFSKPFIHEHLFALLPKSHRLSKKHNIKLSDLAHEKILIHNKIGFWYNVCKENIPDATFLEQEELSTLREIAQVTKLPSFVTDISEKNTSAIPKGKVAIPITDAEVNVQFWCVCKAENAREYAAIFQMIQSIETVGR